MFDLVEAKMFIETLVLLIMSLWTFKTRSDWNQDGPIWRVLNIFIIIFLIWQYVTLRGMKVTVGG